MKEFLAGKFDIAVIGAGHAGIEAALAAARMGLETVIFTINLDAVGNMPCNPAIGGTGKGHLVRELDALGGEMGRAADLACIQYRMLNRGKGPAVHSLRAQADRRKYQQVMKHTLERQEQPAACGRGRSWNLRAEGGRVRQVVTAHRGRVSRSGRPSSAPEPICRGAPLWGSASEDSGPDGMHAAGPLTEALTRLGLPLRRFKTGTPPRVNARSIDFSKMEVQRGDEDPAALLLFTRSRHRKTGLCASSPTPTEETHRYHPGESGPQPPLFRGHRGGGPPVLPVH